jgi:hypothetical protein
MKHLHLEAPLPAGLRGGQGGQERVRDAVHHAAPVHIFVHPCGYRSMTFASLETEYKLLDRILTK